jgi:CHAT domain-containing protein
MHPKQPNIRLLLIFASLTIIGLFFFILYLRSLHTPNSSKNPSPALNQTHEKFNQAEQFLNRGDELHKKFQYKDAIKAFNEALRLYQKANSQAKEAITLGRIGRTYHDLANYKEAIKYHEERLRIAKSIKDRQEESAALSSLGNAYDLMGNYAEALKYHRQSLNVSQTINYLLGQAIAEGELGSIYHKLGDYETAIRKHNERLRIAVELEDRNLSLKLAGDAFSGLGNAYYAQAEYRTDKTPENCNKKRENYNEAIKYHNLHLKIAQEISNHRGEAIAWGSLGSVYHHFWKCDKNQNDLDKAIEYQNKRLNIARAINDRRLEGSAYGGLAYVYHSLKDYSETIKYTENYLEISRHIQDYPGQGNALNLLGVTYFQSDKFTEAITNIEEAINVRKSLREELTDTEKVFIFDTQQNTYLNLQEVLISQRKIERALEIAEQGRAQAFLDLLINQLNGNQEISKAINIEEIKKIAFEQKATLVVYSIVENSIIDHSKPLYIWVVKPTGEVEFRTNDLNNFKKELSNQSNTRQQGSQNLVDDWRDLVVAWDRSVDGPNKAPVPGSKQEEQKEILQAYYNLLIEPIDELLPTKENEKVIFVPQGALFLVPFAALQNPSNEKYLIQKHTILTAPSIQAIQILSQRRTQQQNIKPERKTEDVLIVGIKKYVKERKKGSRQFCSKDYPLKDLPKAAEEATEIAKILGLSPAKVLIDDKATEAAVKQQLPQARIIHLATHGLLDSCEEEAVPGAIALAESSETDKPNDSWLTASEIFEMKDKEDRRLDKAELVVLSACDTGGGRLTGDGVIGLSRSLIAAGTPSVVVSLRRVNDKSTKVLMTKFYHYWYKNKLDKAQALRLAMLDTMKTRDKETNESYENPSYWAVFTLIGLP